MFLLPVSKEKRYKPKDAKPRDKEVSRGNISTQINLRKFQFLNGIFLLKMEHY